MDLASATSFAGASLPQPFSRATPRIRGSSSRGAGAGLSMGDSENGWVNCRKFTQDLFHADFRHQVIQGGAGDAEQFGGLGDVALAVGERPADCLALGMLPYLAQVEGLGFALTAIEPEVDRGNLGAVGHDGGALDEILHFAHVAGPAMGFECAQCIGGETLEAAPKLARVAFEESLCEQHGVAGTFAQRRNVYRDFGQPVVQIFAEA